VLRDAIGLMYIDPQIGGPSKIEMVYDGGTEMRAARVISLLSALLLVAASIVSFSSASRSRKRPA
jgi:hypothetical protein